MLVSFDHSCCWPIKKFPKKFSDRRNPIILQKYISLKCEIIFIERANKKVPEFGQFILCTINSDWKSLTFKQLNVNDPYFRPEIFPCSEMATQMTKLSASISICERNYDPINTWDIQQFTIECDRTNINKMASFAFQFKRNTYKEKLFLYHVHLSKNIFYFRPKACLEWNWLKFLSAYFIQNGNGDWVKI